MRTTVILMTPVRMVTVGVAIVNDEDAAAGAATGIRALSNLQINRHENYKRF